MTTKILHVVLNLHHGGLERVLGDLLRSSDQARFDQHVLALDFLGDMARGLEEHATLGVAAPMSRWSMFRPTSLRREIERIAPDIVHTHSGVWYKASLAARQAGVPFLVHTDHGRQAPDPWLYRFLDGLASRRTDRVIAVSQVLAHHMARNVVRDASIIRVIPNGIDTDRLQGDGEGSRIRAELGIPGDAPLLGSIGRLDPIKRFDLMIEAFGHLLQSWPSGPRPALVIAGDGPDQPRLKEVVARYGLEGDVHLLGWRNDIDDLHAAFTVFTMSSRSEGTSIALLEAMSAGLCPVVTDVGGNAHVLGEGLAHRLCVPEDPGALVTAWRRALADPEARERDGRVARKRVVEQFSVRKMVEEHALVYEEGLGATAASRSCHG